MPSQSHRASTDGKDANSTALQGAEIEGREIVVCWNDGVWYDAIVVEYYPKDDEYKLVYRSDDCLEITSLKHMRWVLAPKKRAKKGSPVLEGSIVELTYPDDGKRYRAMVYDAPKGGEKLKIAYLNDFSTDCVVGGGWEFVTESPCKEDDGSVEPGRNVGPKIKKVIKKKTHTHRNKSG